MFNTMIFGLNFYTLTSILAKKTYDLPKILMLLNVEEIAEK
jgi:hypothetical protein